jgi:hypothetical protein
MAPRATEARGARRGGRPLAAVPALGAWLAALASGALGACSAPEQETYAPPERVAENEEPIHSFHAGPPPWKHVLTCFGGCAPPHYDASACNHHTSCGPIANGQWWYSTERAAFHCGAKLKLERGGKCVVVDVEDNGPADWVEANADQKCGTPYIIDASPLVHDYFGGGCGWGECFTVMVSPVPDATPTGPDGCAQCECKAGEVETQGCGNCGTRQRTCGGDCHWGGWSGCGGEGPCAPGAVDTRPCCDCGQQSRSCSNSCQWGGFGACGGPDPDGGKDTCDTGEPGICASGHVRCADGCRQCARDHDPRPETCNDLDDDCNGEVDDGHPQTVGDPQPRWAARLDDESHPGSLGPGEAGDAWATFTNVGSERWPAGEVWLTSMAAAAGTTSPLRAAEWPAWDVAAVLGDDVPAGASARVLYRLRAPVDPRSLARDELALLAPDGAPMRCPSPDVSLELEVDPGAPQAAAPPAPPPDDAGACALGTAGGARGGDGALLAGVVAAAAARLRRRRGRAGRVAR